MCFLGLTKEPAQLAYFSIKPAGPPADRVARVATFPTYPNIGCKRNTAGA